MARNPSAQRKLLMTVLGWSIALVLFFPVLWTILTSFKTHADAIASPPLFFHFDWTLEAYRILWHQSDIRRYLLNSLLISVGATAIAIVIGVPAAWALAFAPTARTKLVLLWMLSTKMLPGIALFMPVYLLSRNLGLLDTRVGLMAILMLLNLPIVIWMLFVFFRDIPTPILEAARMDGASLAAEIVLILIPLALPAIFSTATLSLILAWNESFWVLLFSASKAGTMSAFLATFSNSPYIAQISAASTIAILPIMILGWFCQQQIVRGLTFGAVGRADRIT